MLDIARRAVSEGVCAGEASLGAARASWRRRSVEAIVVVELNVVGCKRIATHSTKSPPLGLAICSHAGSAAGDGGDQTPNTLPLRDCVILAITAVIGFTSSPILLVMARILDLWLSVVCILGLFSSFSLADDEPCTARDGNNFYDLSSLKSK